MKRLAISLPALLTAWLCSACLTTTSGSPDENRQRSSTVRLAITARHQARAHASKRAHAIKQADCQREARAKDAGIWQVPYVGRRGNCDRRKAQEVHAERVRSRQRDQGLFEIHRDRSEQVQQTR